MVNLGSENLYGEVWDFRDVQEFLPDNLMDARKKSRGLNLRINVDFPVAMIVKDFYQEEILRGPMQNVPRGIASFNELVNRFPSEGEYPPRALTRIADGVRRAVHRIWQPEGQGSR